MDPTVVLLRGAGLEPSTRFPMTPNGIISTYVSPDRQECPTPYQACALARPMSRLLEHALGYHGTFHGGPGWRKGTPLGLETAERALGATLWSTRQSACLAGAGFAGTTSMPKSHPSIRLRSITRKG